MTKWSTIVLADRASGSVAKLQKTTIRTEIARFGAPSKRPYARPQMRLATLPWIRTRQICTARKGDSAVFCTKKEGYFGSYQAITRVDSTVERLHSHCSFVYRGGALRSPSAKLPKIRQPCLKFSPSEGGSTLDRGLGFEFVAKRTHGQGNASGPVLKGSW